MGAVKIILIVLVVIIGALAIMNHIMFPSKLMKYVGSPVKYVEKIKTGEIVQMSFKEFLREYSKSKGQFIVTKEFLRVLMPVMKQNGKGTQLKPLVVHFRFFDKLRYMKWVKSSDIEKSEIQDKAIKSNNQEQSSDKVEISNSAMYPQFTHGKGIRKRKHRKKGKRK